MATSDMVRTILDIHNANVEDPDGDKWLSSSDYALEAIDAIVNDYQNNPTLRMFLEALPTATA
jgi:hypothetical protein